MSFNQRQNYDPAELAKVPEAPVYRPTEAEFEEPMAYIRSIWYDAAQSGIVKIIPPAGWKSGASKDAFDEALSFSTRLQDVHKLRHRHRGVNERFRAYVEQYSSMAAAAARSQNTLEFPPTVSFHRRGGKRGGENKWRGSKREVDLYQLYLAVIQRGGLGRVCEGGLWGQIARDLRMPTEYEELFEELEEAFVTYLSDLPRPEVVLAKFPPPESSAACATVHNGAANPLAEDEQGAMNNNSSSSTVSTTPSVDGVAQRNDSVRYRSVRNDVFPVCCYDCKQPFQTDTMGAPEHFVTCWQCGITSHTPCFDGKFRPAEEGRGGIWVCNGDCSYGFESGETFTMAEYRTEVGDFKKTWMRSRMQPDGKPVRWQDIEEEYWRIVEDPTRAVYVRYGSDLDTNRTGSGFPCSRNQWKEHPSRKAGRSGASASGGGIEGEEGVLSTWNLNILPSVCGSLLKYFRDSIKGINVPWLYCGSMFSTFCYHAEDLNMMSINYMHQCDEGGGKVWYGVPPGEGALMFEASLRTAVPELFRAQPGLQYELVTMVSPVELRARGTSVCRTVQRPGEFILTFPQAFHGGFSLGYNVAEAVNFFTPECFPWMRAGVRNAHVYRRSPVFCYVEFMVQLGARLGVHSDLSASDVEQIAEELERIERKAQSDRSKLITGLWGQYELVSERFKPGEICSRCEQHCTLSIVERVENGDLFCLDCVVEDIDCFADKSGSGPRETHTRYRVEDFLSSIHLKAIVSRARKAGIVLRSAEEGKVNRKAMYTI